MTQPIRQRQILRGRAGIQTLEQMFDCAHSHVLGGLHDGSKTRRRALADLDTIESGHGDVVRHPQSQGGESPNGGDGEHVRGAEDRRRRGVA